MREDCAGSLLFERAKGFPEKSEIRGFRGEKGYLRGFLRVLKGAFGFCWDL
jgi:hypothetical protein